MLTLVLALLSFLGGRATRLTDPLPGSVDTVRMVPTSKWASVVPQYAAGLAGAVLGGLGGAVTGGLFGVFVWMGDGQKYQPDCNTVCTPEAGTQIGTGARIGAMLGGALGVTRLVILSSPKEYPSKNPLGTFAGAVAGGGAAWIATRSMLEDDGGYTWPRWGVLAASSSLGAVLADRWLADPLPVSMSVAAWVPTPGANGLMLRIDL